MATSNDEILEIVVIGTGPAGIAAIAQLRKLGMAPVVLDSGFTMPDFAVAQQNEKRSRLELKITADDAPNLDRYVIGKPPPTKKKFGSDFVFEKNSAVQIQQHDVDLGVSFAQGGLSNVWGASCMLFSQSDTRNWPLEHKDIYAHIDDVQEIIKFSSDQRFKISSPYIPDTSHNRLMNSIYTSLLGQSRATSSSETMALPSCLAVNTEIALSELCKNCRSCLRGCPVEAIFSAEQILKSFISEGLDYRPNNTVIRLNEVDEGVEIVYLNSTQQKVKVRSRRVVLACGPVISTGLILGALGEKRKVVLQECSAVTIPLVSLRKVINDGHGTTLADLFVEIRDTQSQTSQAHFQCYGPSPELILATSESAKKFHLPNFVEKFLLSRALVAHGFFKPALSTGITIEVVEANDCLKISASASASALHKRHLSKQLLKTFGRFLLRGRIVALISLAHREPIGRSYHLSSSFPMSDDAELWNTSDLMGRPRGLKFVHVVDATVLPDVPPQSPTLTVMCNSARISSLLVEDMKKHPPTSFEK